MNDVDDILTSLGISQSDNPSTEVQAEVTQEVLSSPTEETEETFTDEDLDNILQDNGFNTMSLEETIIPLEEEDNNEESEEENEGTTPPPVELPEDSDSENEEKESTGAKLPLNSPTLLINDSTTRFSGAEWFNEIQKARIIIGGCGGIGSNLAFQIARMVPANITIYDDDTVEMVNMAGQLFSLKDIGKSKVDAMEDMITSYTSMRQVNAIKDKFSYTTEPGDIMLCGFDNMNARMIFFESWKRHLKGMTEEEKSKCLFMDGRLSMTELQILCIRGDDTYNINRYDKEFLFLDSEAEVTVCSRKQTTYLACMIGSLMTNLFTNFIANLLNPVIPYDLPFFIEYDAQNMIFNTES